MDAGLLVKPIAFAVSFYFFNRYLKKRKMKKMAMEIKEEKEGKL